MAYLHILSDLGMNYTVNRALNDGQATARIEETRASRQKSRISIPGLRFGLKLRSKPRTNSAEILHWMVFNIPATARQLPEGVPAQAQLPDGTIQGRNYTKKVGYVGMGAPAPGPYHHYTFELFALDIKLALGANANQTEVLNAMDNHILAKAVVVGRFHLP